MLISKKTLEMHGAGYYIHRIPGIICTRKGTILAYCESRSGGDWSAIDITMRRSTDDGASWEDRKILVHGEGQTTNNPVMFSDTQSDRIHFIWHRNYEKAYYQFSDNQGESWSTPEDITYVYDEFRSEYDWCVIAAGPGHGLCLSDGTLFVPVWLSSSKKHMPSVSGCIYSDDHGKTWKRGGLIPGNETIVNPNETVAAELSNGDIIMNIRNTGPDYRRGIAISHDRGQTFTEAVAEDQIKDPQCAAGMTSIIGKDGYPVILFTNCNSDFQSRTNLTLRVSHDDCITWKEIAIIEEKSGYSDLCVNPVTGTLFCYYECGWMNGKHFLPLSLNIASIQNFAESL